MTLTAILIGNESLTVQCGEMWLARGHAIACVMTHNAEVRVWAQAKSLPVELPEAQVDVILSVANLSVIGPEMLARAKRAVNFHDGPLPRHAGLNAPVWAILDGDVQHGITWHAIEGGVDEGRILEQRMFEISPDETALTLNTKCFAAAMESFPGLMDALERGEQGQAQDLMRRTLHLRVDRPTGQGRLDFNGRAEDVLRVVRALDHGSYLNPLTSAKIAAGNQVYCVRGGALADGQGLPGQVIATTVDGLVVACADGAVRLVVDAPGVTFVDSPTVEDAARLTQALAAVVPGEPAVRRALLAMTPATVQGTGVDVGWRSVPVMGDVLALAAGYVRLSGQTALDFAIGAQYGRCRHPELDLHDELRATRPKLVPRLRHAKHERRR